MNVCRLASDLADYLARNPQDQKTPQIIESIIYSDKGIIREALGPDVTHLNLTFDIRDNKLVRINPDISIKI